MTVGPSVGDAVSGQPSSPAATAVARGGYQGGQPAGADTGGEPSFDIGGQQVPLSELQRGYLRQSDYTQKTQQLSGQRQQYEAASRLVEALQSDPHGTLLQLAEASGVDLGSLQNPQGQGFGEGGFGQAQGQDPGQGLDPNDPVHAELIALRQQVQELSQGQESMEDHQANAWLDQETATAAQLFEQSGLEFDPEELYQYAAEREIADVQTAAKALAWDKFQTSQSQQPQQLPEEFAAFSDVAGQQFQGQGPSQRAPLPPQQRAAMAAQTPRGPLTSASQHQPMPEPNSLSEAFAQTLSELGVGDLRQIDMGN